LQALCGACWQGSMCIAPDGGVSPCIMSKAMPVGSALTSSLADLVEGTSLRDARQLIRDKVWTSREGELSECPPSRCEPNCGPWCAPCLPLCNPTKPPSGCGQGTA
jgi:hypothetical protein